MMVRFLLIALMAGCFVSCTESKTANTEEEKEIRVMDSTEKVVKEKMEELEDQTDKVEQALEKIDQEYEEKN